MADPASWGLLDEDCTGIGDWDDGDTGSGESSVDPAGQFKFLTGAKGAGVFAKRSRDIGSYPNTFTVEAKVYHDAIGTRADTDYFLLHCAQANEGLFLGFCVEGLVIYDNDSGDTEVGTDLVKEGGSAEWQTWRVLVTFTGVTGDGTCDVYLKDSAHPDWTKVGTAIPCSYEAGSDDGTTAIVQYAYNTADRITHVDYFKIATGLYSPIFVPQVIII